MCSVCPKCAPPDDSLGSYTPVQPVELTEDYWAAFRRWEFPVGGLICSCPPEEAADE